MEYNNLWWRNGVLNCYFRLEDLFQAQGVDLVLQAHEHSYERLWPVYDYQVMAKNYLDPRAPVHVISGAAGCGENVDYMGDPSKSGLQVDYRRLILFMIYFIYLSLFGSLG